LHPEPSTHRIDISDGGLSAPTGRYEKRLRDLAGIYGDRAAFDAAVAAEGDRVVYSVANVRPAAKAGDLSDADELLGLLRSALEETKTAFAHRLAQDR